MTDAETALAAAQAAAASVTTTAANVDLATQQADRAETAKSDAETARDDAQSAASTAATDALAAVTPANDVAITAVDADAGSAFRVQQDARLSTTFAAALHVRPGKAGVVGNGTGDDTAAIQAILDQVSPALGITDVVIHDGTYMVNGIASAYPAGVSAQTRNKWIEGGLRPKSGTTLLLTSGAILKVIPNGSPGYSCIYLGRTQNNITIRGGQILGDRATHDYATEPTYTTHEYGYGISLRGATGIRLQDVTVTGCTGDNLFVGAEGQLTISTYYPSEVVARGCTFDGARRNNISVIGCTRAIFDGCTITRAGYDDGIHAGTLPKFGIDLEGNGDGAGVDWQTPLNVTVRNCVLTSNTLGSIMNFNGYGVVIEGNYSDHTISFGYGTETIVRGNVVKNLANTTATGISSNDFSAGTGYDANSVVANNVVEGFDTGITVQRDDVLVVGNFVSKYQTTGISVFGCDGVTVEGNRVTDGLGATATAYQVGTATKVSLLSNTSRNNYRGFYVTSSSTQVLVENNAITQGVQGANITASCQVVIKGNTFDLPGHAGGQSSDITWSATATVLCEGNVFRNSSTYSITASNTVASAKARIIRNTVIDSTSLNQFLLTGTTSGRFEVVGNTFIMSRTSGSPDAVALSGTQDKSLVMGNTAYHSNTTVYRYLINCTAATVTNTRAVGNSIVTAQANVITGDGGTPVTASNNLVAA